MSRSRRAQAILTVLLVLLGPVLAVLTLFALGEFDARDSRNFLRVMILLDLVYVITLAALVAMRVARSIADRRRKSAGSRLHMRLMLVFSVVAMAPTILVAIFATITINFGLETWFSERVRSVLATSLSAAQAYETEHRDNLAADARLLADFLDRAKRRNPLISGGELREMLARGQAQMQREIAEAFIIDGSGRIVSRGADSYLFDYEPPPEAEIDAAVGGETRIIEDWPNNELRALIHLGSFADRFLYVTRRVDGKILSLLDDTKDTVSFYQQLEAERGQLLFEFALIYIGFALLVIVAAIWLGMWFADRLSKPVGRLAAAAERVGEGDLDVRVAEESGDDEIAMLSRIFNRMTAQVKRQRDALIEVNTQTERRRRLFEAVLSGVTAGVVGLDGQGRIEVLNDAAARMLGLHGAIGRDLRGAAPDLALLFDRMLIEGRIVVQDQIHVTTGEKPLDLLVRITRRTVHGSTEGFVVMVDDLTELLAAQRMAAWGDIARRIAHEIKNPLTPIQLSAERLKRKFGPRVGADRETLEQYAEVIIRQTADLRRIVDEFSRFARMPAPERRPQDLGKLVRDAVLLQQSARGDIEYVLDLPEAPVELDLDATQIGQCLTNALKNATEAIDSRQEKHGPDTPPGRIGVRLESTAGVAVLSICDNGIGLPQKQRARLFEPYVTTREKGTGLGLSIVRKIVEDHGGRITLEDAPPDEQGHRGAMFRISFPVKSEVAVNAQHHIEQARRAS
ncbi:MAG: PAS domain-containing sensor histidine kinase [Alphaproteobacteria bacterium]|nr:MAG: PAS domain-containing sensor histidine kinase [Alphaproteobacteria bacterium]